MARYVNRPLLMMAAELADIAESIREAGAEAPGIGACARAERMRADAAALRRYADTLTRQASYLAPPRRPRKAVERGDYESPMPETVRDWLPARVNG